MDAEPEDEVEDEVECEGAGRLPPVLVDGRHLTVAGVAAVAAGASVVLDAEGRRRAAAAWRAAQEASEHQPVYGLTTDVGAAKGRVLAEEERRDARALLVPHAVGPGEPLPPSVVRAGLGVRLNQLAAGGAGCPPEVLDALVEMLIAGPLPVVHDGATLGTGDLSALADVGLAVHERHPLTRHEALALMSSGAFTLAGAALQAERLVAWSEVATTVAAASTCALRADLGFADPAVHAARRQPGAEAVAAAVRRLVGTPTWRPATVQAAYGIRCLPQVHGALDESAQHLIDVLAVDINAAAENPLIDAGSGRALHHGGFHLGRLALALDHARAALHQAASLAIARLAEILDPDASGWPAGDGSSSGAHRLLGLEYVAHAELARLRQAAQPVTLGSAVLAGGAEPHAPFAPEGARQLGLAIGAADEIVACELVAAAAAIRETGVTPPPALRPLLDAIPGGAVAVRDEILAGRAALQAIRGARRRSRGRGAPAGRGLPSSRPAPRG